jgi:hypothetical protein
MLDSIFTLIIDTARHRAGRSLAAQILDAGSACAPADGESRNSYLSIDRLAGAATYVACIAGCRRLRLGQPDCAHFSWP